MSGVMEIRAPEFPESVMEGTVAVWHCAVGDHFRRDQLLVDIETDKVVLEVRATAAGRLEEIVHAVGDTVHSGELIGRCAATEAVQESEPAAAAHQPGAEEDAPSAAKTRNVSQMQDVAAQAAPPAAQTRPASAPPPSAAARRLLEEHGLSAEEVPASGRGGRLTKGDVLQHLARRQTETALPATPSPATQAAPPTQPPPTQAPLSAAAPDSAERRPQKRAPMSRLRARIAERLLAVSRDTAMLSTFNEADMSAVRELRRSCGEAFLQRHGVKLGMMSFFVRAAVCALRDFPILNASIDGADVVYHGFFDIGVAVSTERGLVVPVLRNAERMSFAEVERSIGDYAARARDGKLSLEEIQGGTFTITNGGVFGSLLSTPILNPPQVGILGMHAIRDRPTAVDGQALIRPIMNLALTYDHRLVDGREAVSFLVRIKQLIEQPALLLPDLQPEDGEGA